MIFYINFLHEINILKFKYLCREKIGIRIRHWNSGFLIIYEKPADSGSRIRIAIPEKIYYYYIIFKICQQTNRFISILKEAFYSIRLQCFNFIKFELEPKNSGTRPAAVPGGLGQPGGPGQPPPGSIPTGELFVVVTSVPMCRYEIQSVLLFALIQLGNWILNLNLNFTSINIKVPKGLKQINGELVY